VRIPAPSDAILERPRIQDAVHDAKARLGPAGRVCLRVSGTESMVRVMVEGTTEEEVNELAGRIALAVERSVGAALDGPRPSD